MNSNNENKTYLQNTKVNRGAFALTLIKVNIVFLLFFLIFNYYGQASVRGTVYRLLVFTRSMHPWSVTKGFCGNKIPHCKCNYLFDILLFRIENDFGITIYHFNSFGRFFYCLYNLIIFCFQKVVFYINSFSGTTLQTFGFRRCFVALI